MRAGPFHLVGRFALATALLGCGRSSTEPTTTGSSASPANAASPRCTTSDECARACEERKDGRACATVAERYFEGFTGHPLDHAKAFGFATRACELNQPHGCALLGFHYQDGLATEWAPKRAIEAYEKGCRLGSGVSCHNLATIYEGHGVEADQARADDFFLRARENWTKACEGDEPRWCTNAAYMISRASKNQPSTAELERMLALNERACEHGTLVGCVEKLRVLEDLKRTDDATLLAGLEALCTQGEPTACTAAGTMVVVSSERGSDAALAARGVKLLDRGCSSGDKVACNQLAFSAITGRYMKSDFAAAERYFEQACDRALGSACAMLATKYQKDATKTAEAVAFSRRACHMGTPDGCFLLATMTAAGQGVAKDDAKAMEWMRAACNHGSLEGCRALLDRGLPTPLPASELAKVHEALCKDGRTASCGKGTP